MLEKAPQEHLAVFYGYACNYSCDQCSSGSDVTGREYDPDWQETLDVVPRLAELFTVNQQISLIGGEPFLYWDDRIVPLLREYRKYFPETKLNIYTNGHLLGKNIDTVIDFMQDIGRFDIRISRHLDHLEQTSAGRVWHESMATLIKHGKIVKIHDQHYHIRDRIDNNFYLTAEWEIQGSKWKSYYYRNPDGKIKPWATNDPVGSLQFGCTGAHCTSIFGSKIYKCGNLSTLPGHLSAIGQFDDPDWKKYVDYPYMDVWNPDPTLWKNFVESYGKSVTWCDMCANKSVPQIKWTDRTYSMIFRKAKTTTSATPAF